MMCATRRFLWWRRRVCCLLGRQPVCNVIRGVIAGRPEVQDLRRRSQKGGNIPVFRVWASQRCRCLAHVNLMTKLDVFGYSPLELLRHATSQITFPCDIFPLIGTPEDERLWRSRQCGRVPRNSAEPHRRSEVDFIIGRLQVLLDTHGGVEDIVSRQREGVGILDEACVLGLGCAPPSDLRCAQTCQSILDAKASDFGLLIETRRDSANKRSGRGSGGTCGRVHSGLQVCPWVAR